MFSQTELKKTENLPVPYFLTELVYVSLVGGWRPPGEGSFTLSASYTYDCLLPYEVWYKTWKDSIYIIYCVRIIGEGVCKTKRIAEVLNRFKSMCLCDFVNSLISVPLVKILNISV